MVQDSSLSPLTPLAIERDFRALLLRLSYPLSARRQLAEIESFLLRIDSDSLLYESYILELAQRIPDIVARLNVLGIDPATLRPLYELLKKLIIAVPSLSSVQGLAGAMQRLRSILSTLYRFVGEAHDQGEFESHDSLFFSGNGASSLVEGLLIPVIERSIVDAPGPSNETGYLRRISVEITGPTDSGEDDFRTQVLVLGQDGGLTNKLTSPILAARSLVARTAPHLQGRHFNGYVTFDELNSFHQGSSANFAIAALLYCAILRHAGARSQFRLHEDVAMTGDINRSAEILPVDPDSLRWKAEAVFFSEIRFFVVPQSQRSITDEVIQSLRSRYPERRLMVIGVHHLEDIFNDRRLSFEVTVNAVEHYLHKAWEKKFQIGVGLILTVLLLILAKSTIPPANDNPVAAEIVSGTLQIENSNGEKLEEIDIGPGARDLAHGPGGQFEAERICKFYDIDGDGKNEFIYLQDEGKNSGGVASLICRVLWKKLPVWQASFQGDFSFPLNPVETRQHLIISGFIVGNFEGTKTPVVFAIAHHLFFPSEVYKLDALTGRVLGSFLHIGHLSIIAAANLEKSGVQKILVAGWNNAFNCTVLCVLDPRLISGVSPYQGAYAPKATTPGTEMYYILIPRTFLPESYEEDVRGNGPLSIDVDELSKSIRLSVADLNVKPPDSNQLLKGNIILTFNDSMQVENINSTTTWDRAANLLYKEGTVQRIPDATYLNRQYRKSLLYWDGTRWQHKPVLNQFYVRALKELEKR